MEPSNLFKETLEKAQKGNREAQYDLAILYYEGLEVDESIDECLEWMTLSYDNGYLPAKAWLEDFYFDDDVNVQANS
ncbi:MAG: SEL1-like repeat protein [Candidatus Izemoplasmatales bacterium]|jgi:TPR repeat protein